MDRMNNKLDQLERALLEMGSEMYRLKSELIEMRDNQGQFIKSMQSLKTLLDEKGMVTEDEFESALDLADIMNKMNSSVDQVQSVFEKLKKIGH